MNYLDLIIKKRDRKELSREEIEYLISGVAKNEIPDYQLSAFLMAVYFNGMNDEETAQLTDAMANSGDTLDLSCFGNLSADKHSTGGVGDKTTLIVAPTLAAIGAKVAKMSGRALGHTGGTVDKLESIPGYKTELSPAEFIMQVEKIGISVIGQSASFAPADKYMYALRDVTGTVSSAPLIASSIMSKKLAAGSHNILLDVKIGSGAFLHTTDEAYKLARMMCDIGRHLGRNVRALLTDMDRPLGSAIGNVLEVKEAIDILKGAGPEDLREVCTNLAGLLCAMVKGISDKDGIDLARETIASGAAYDKFKEWISTQGGDARYITAPELFGKAAVELEIKSERDGYISTMNTETIGNASTALGAGRINKETKIDPLAGIILHKKTGDKVSRGEVIAVLHSASPEKAEAGARIFKEAISYSDTKPEERPLIFDVV